MPSHRHRCRCTFLHPSSIDADLSQIPSTGPSLASSTAVAPNAVTPRGWAGHRRRLELTSKFTVGRTPWRTGRFCSVGFRVPFVRFHARTWHEVPLHVLVSWRDAEASAWPRPSRTEDGRSLRSTIGIGTGWERRTRLERQPVHRSGEGGTCLARSRCLCWTGSMKRSNRKAVWERERRGICGETVPPFSILDAYPFCPPSFCLIYRIIFHHFFLLRSRIAVQTLPSFPSLPGVPASISRRGLPSLTLLSSAPHPPVLSTGTDRVSFRFRKGIDFPFRPVFTSQSFPFLPWLTKVWDVRPHRTCPFRRASARRTLLAILSSRRGGRWRTDGHRHAPRANAAAWKPRPADQEASRTYGG